MELTKEKPLDITDQKIEVKILLKIIQAKNAAAILPATELSGLGQTVLRGYEIDKQSREPWERINEEAMKLATQVAEIKSFPWAGAANVKYPLITTSAIQFHARAYPAIIQGRQVAKGVVNGFDPEGQKKARADRIGKHMSFQVLEEMDDWEEETDKLLLNLAIVGCNFRKTYFDKHTGKNCSIFVSAEQCVVNHGAKNLEVAPRITQVFELYRNEIEERERSGSFIKLDCYPHDEDDSAIMFLEQHNWADLDEDGYKEPYIVTVHKETGSVVRIVPRFTEDSVEVTDGIVSKINPDHYWTKYSFIPNPDGGFYDIGLGSLLGSINSSINTIINQIFDAGTKQNAGGGFIGSGLRLKAGSMRFAPGEYKPVNQSGAAIRDNIYNIEHPGPSAVLFNLLGLLIEAGKDISSVKDILTGEGNKNETATSTLALIEQGQKVFTAIYKRIHRSLGKELKKLYVLNKKYLPVESYYRVLDTAYQIGLEDYQGDETDITPISDPTMSTEAQELARAEAYMRLIGDPYTNQVEIRRKYFKALKEENVESILLEQPQPDPAQLQEQLQQMQEQMQQMQQQGQQLEQEYMEYQQTSKDLAAKLKAENTALKQNMDVAQAEDLIKNELSKVEEARREAEATIEKAINEIEMEKSTHSVAVQNEIDTAITQVKNLIAMHEVKMQGFIQSAKSEEGEKEDKTPEIQQTHQEFMGAVGGILTGLQSLTETLQRPRKRTLITDEEGNPISAVETIE